jgi:acetoin utilization protein AcuB
MEKDVVTVSPETTSEEAVSIAQSNKVGCLVVVDKGQVVGITTTNDFFYNILNPILGLGNPGTRIEVAGAGSGKELEDVISTVNKKGLEILTLHIEVLPDKDKKDICIHVDDGDVKELVSELKAKGYEVNLRRR